MAASWTGRRPSPGPVVVRARAPLRLGLAGGGTDIPSYYETYGGCVLNATIDRYAYATIEAWDEPSVRFSAADLRVETTTGVSDPLEIDGNLDLHKSVYREMMAEYNDGAPFPLNLTTYCDAPVGSGLGSSSTLVVAMIRAFAELLRLPLDDYAIADMAFRIERVDCGLAGGKQDQFSASFGGFNFIDFRSDGRTIVNSLRIKNWIVCELEASLILFHTGTSRESSRIISSQSSGVAGGETAVLEAMHAIKSEASTMKDALIRGDFSAIVDSLRKGWDNKKRSAAAVSNPRIDEIYDAALGSGALAGKLSGAGGGGFMLFFVRPDRRMDVIRTLNRFGGRVGNCHFTKHGSQAWIV